jgi:hypothetical protein
MGITKSTLPDVCKTPSPGGPVPIPYPVIVSMANSLKKGTSEYSRCNGDEPGTAGGVKSSTNMKEATWLLYSFDVKLEGKNACRLSDKMMMNHGNTVCLGGTIHAPVPGVADVDCEAVLMKFPVEPYDEQKKKKGPPYDGCQSHHVIQNSHFQYPRGETLAEICPGYSEGKAPCIPLEDGTDTSTAHGRVSQMQKADAKSHRKAYRETGKSPSYDDARADAKKQLTDKDPGPALSEDEAECILLEVDKIFEEMCEDGMKDTSNFKLRPPGQRGKGLPKPAGSGGGIGGAL